MSSVVTTPEPIALEEKLLNVKEAASYLSITPQTLYCWIKDKRIKFVSFRGRYFFKPSVIARAQRLGIK